MNNTQATADPRAAYRKALKRELEQQIHQQERHQRLARLLMAAGFLVALAIASGYSEDRDSHVLAPTTLAPSITSAG